MTAFTSAPNKSASDEWIYRTDVRPPFCPVVADADVAINVPLLHRLLDEGVLTIWQEGPPPGRKGRLYALTAQGARRLAELRCHVREIGQRALTATAADLDTLAQWTPRIGSHVEGGGAAVTRLISSSVSGCD